LFPELTNQLFFPLGHYGLPALRAKFRGWRKFIAPLKGTARIDPIIPKGQKGFSSRMVIDVFVTKPNVLSSRQAAVCFIILEVNCYKRSSTGLTLNCYTHETTRRWAHFQYFFIAMPLRRSRRKKECSWGNS